jgi:hypothetical protein
MVGTVIEMGIATAMGLHLVAALPMAMRTRSATSAPVLAASHAAHHVPSCTRQNPISGARRGRSGAFLSGCCLTGQRAASVGEDLGGADVRAEEAPTQGEFGVKDRRDRTQEVAGSSPASSIKDQRDEVSGLRRAHPVVVREVPGEEEGHRRYRGRAGDR